MYDRLSREFEVVTPATLTEYFKRATFSAEAVESEETPKPGVKIVRDAKGVPHIYGDTDIDVIWGAGWATADDRMFMSDVLRHVGRGRLAEFLGATGANLAMDRDMARVAGYTEEELQFQLEQLPRKFGPLGELSLQSFRAFTQGMNAWIQSALADPRKIPSEYAALQQPLLPWKETDSVAVATLIQAVFAVGGGGELRNAALLQALRERFPNDPAKAETLYRDLLVREEPEASPTTTESFPYLAPPPSPDPASVAIPDMASVEFADPIRTLKDDLADLGLVFPQGMSNWLAVDAAHAEGGIPIGVMGPQVGYFSPEILLELDLHGPTINTRGAAFPGISIAVLLGRGIDFAWSATSGGSDLVDIRAERLCEPNPETPVTKESTHYMLLGQCIPMYERTDRYLAKPSAAGVVQPEVVTVKIERTVHGPVAGRATVTQNGQTIPVALSIQRSTWFGEVDSAPAFALLNTNAVHDPQTFFEAMNHVTGSFNWLYVSHDEVAYFHSGLYPRRAPGVDPELPTWGTGEWEWQGFLSQDEHPHVTLGAQGPVPKHGSGPGFITSWNNKPARDWQSADANYSYGTIHRVQSLNERLEERLAAKHRLSVVDMVQVMADAATVDLRGTQILPKTLELLAGRADVAD